MSVDELLVETLIPGRSPSGMKRAAGRPEAFRTSGGQAATCSLRRPTRSYLSSEAETSSTKGDNHGISMF